MRPLDRFTSIKAKIGTVIVLAVGVTIVTMYALLVGLGVYHADEANAVTYTGGFLRRVWWQLLLAGAVAGAVALGLVKILARGMTRPLREMADGARRMAQGDYTVRVHTPSRDEVGRLADAFNRMASELERTERLRRDLVANVSHELKTPISALRAHLENLIEGVGEPDRETLAVMLRQAERLSGLVEQLLDLSRLEAGDVPLELEPVALARLVSQAIEEVRLARPGRALDLRSEVPVGLPPVPADRRRLHQVLFNLLDNALRFTPDGGRVVIRAVPADGWCEVAVEDNGPGIAEEHLGRVFERFYRADRSRSRDDGGAGLGLAIARSIIEAHGGRIWAAPVPGGGCGIHLLLPGMNSRRTEDHMASKEDM